MATTLVSSWWSYLTEAPPSPPPPLPAFPLALPPELILHILTLTIPSPTFSNSKQRTLTLLGYTLLCRDWSTYFQRQLQRDLHFTTLRSCERFLSARHLHREDGWGKRVKSLRIGEEQEENGWSEAWNGGGSGNAIVKGFLKTCTEVEELWLHGVIGLEASVLADGKNLRRLYIRDTRIVAAHPTPYPTPTSLSLLTPLLPNLTHLHLKSVIFSGPSLSLLLSPSSLPSLHTLDLLSLHQSLVSVSDAIGGANGILSSLASRRSQSLYAEIAPQIQHLALGEYASKTIPLSDLWLFTSLKSLDLPLGVKLSSPGTLSLPSTLRSLRWRMPLRRPREAEGEEWGQDAVEMAVQNGLEVFEMSGGEGRRWVTVPSLGEEVEEQVMRLKGVGGAELEIAVRRGGAGDGEEAVDGPFEVGIERARKALRERL